MKDYYYFLGLPQNATTEEIKKIYRKLSVKYHPDKNDNDAFFENRFREVQEAYDILIDENKRKTMTNYEINKKNRKIRCPTNNKILLILTRKTLKKTTLLSLPGTQ